MKIRKKYLFYVLAFSSAIISSLVVSIDATISATVIKDAWAIPSLDVDTLLVAIRVASYGHEMEFGTACPKCNHESNQAIDLRTVLDSMKAADYNECLESGDMKIFFKPMTYKNLTDNNQLQFVAGNNFEKIDETNIGADQIVGKITPIKIPYLGWIKLIFFEPFRDSNSRGFC